MCSSKSTAGTQKVERNYYRLVNNPFLFMYLFSPSTSRHIVGPQ